MQNYKKHKTSITKTPKIPYYFLFRFSFFVSPFPKLINYPPILCIPSGIHISSKPSYHTKTHPYHTGFVYKIQKFGTKDMLLFG